MNTSERSQTQTDEKDPRGLGRVAAWAGRVVKSLVGKRERTPEDVGVQFTRLVDKLTTDTEAGRRGPAGRHQGFDTIIRSGVAQAPNGGMYGVLVERSTNGTGVDKIMLEGLSPDAPRARVVYQGPNTAEPTVARRTFDPRHPGAPVRAPGDGVVDAQGFAQLSEVLNLTQWDPVEVASAARPGVYSQQR